MNGIRRGHLRFYILRLLMEAPATGYGLIKAIETETGFWRPSAGSLYPLLSAMEKSQLIETDAEHESPRWRITEKGRAAFAEALESRRDLFRSMRNSLVVFSKVFDIEPLESMADRLAHWEEGRSDFQTLGPLFMDLHDALWSLPPLSGPKEARACEILNQARDALIELHQEEKSPRDPA